MSVKQQQSTKLLAHKTSKRELSRVYYYYYPMVGLGIRHRGKLKRFYSIWATYASDVRSPFPLAIRNQALR